MFFIFNSLIFLRNAWTRLSLRPIGPSDKSIVSNMFDGEVSGLEVRKTILQWLYIRLNTNN